MNIIHFQSSKNIWFVSDLHIHHRQILRYSYRNIFLSKEDREELKRRGEKWNTEKGSRYDWKISDESIANMNEGLLENINKYVGKNDILFDLGDWSMKPRTKSNLKEYFNRCKEFRDRVKCHNIIHISGNHDDYIINSLFSSSHNLLNIKIDQQNVTLCHYPQLSWYRVGRGSYCLYGNEHGSIEGWLHKNMNGIRAMDVGVDNAYKILGEYRPFSWKEICDIMSTRNGFSLHHANEE